MEIRLKYCLFFLIVILLFISPDLYATTISDMIESWRNKIGEWKNYFYLSLSSVIAIAVLGFISGILQIFKKKTIQAIAISCAFSVTLITIVVNVVEIKGHKTINKAIIEAETIVSKLEILHSKSLLKKDDLGYQFVVLEEVSKLTSKLHIIQKQISYFDLLDINLIPTAYAEQPSWITLESFASDDKGTINIIGFGEGVNLLLAKAVAKQSIEDQTTNFIQKGLEVIVREKITDVALQAQALDLIQANSSLLASAFVKNLNEKESYFEEITEDSYQYFVLYQITASQLKETLKLYSTLITK